MATLSALEPVEVWENFQTLCAIPHPSGFERQLGEYLLHFGAKLGLKSEKDETGNIIIFKPAGAGYEQRPPLILQAHLDMVPQKNRETEFDFTKDKIRPYVDGDWIRAGGTTLGADNGIGVAAMMGILATKNWRHGPLEMLFTVEEETGLTGAVAVGAGALKGRLLLNLDSEHEEEICVGCAGGINTQIRFELDWVPTPARQLAYKIVIANLLGGHSGIEINLGRANAVKVLAALIWELTTKLALRSACLQGGNLRNAIPREAEALVTFPDHEEAVFSSLIRAFAENLKRLYPVEKNLKVEFEPAPLPTEVMSGSGQAKLIDALNVLPNGVIRMSTDFPGLVETSTNLGSLTTQKPWVLAETLQRSSNHAARVELVNRIASLAALAGAEMENSGAYPGWKPNLDSPLLSLVKSCYREKYGRAPQVTAIHAGLECGLFREKFPDLDMVSIGPEIRGPHSPDEKVRIASVKNFWDLLLEILARIN